MNWQITNLLVKQLVDGLANVVVIVEWTCSKADGDAFGSISQSTQLQPPSSDSFTPYDHLTKDQVLGWIWSSGVDKASVESSVQAQISQSKAPAPVVGLAIPWN
jgi:hypothetical protein